MKNDFKFPKIDKALTDFLNDEDGNIARNKLVSIGSLVLLMSILSIESVFAHSSHSSHSSHKSHSSTSYIRDHTNHSSHSDHGSHSSHSSHTSHSNTSSHSNSLYSDEGDVTYGPKVSEIPEVNVFPVENNEVMDFSNVADVSIEEATEANTSLLNMNLPEVPKAGNVGSVNDTGLEFKTGTVEAMVELASLVGGTTALVAGSVGAAKMGIDKAASNRRKEKAKNNLKVYNDQTVEEKLNVLKEESDIEVNKAFLQEISKDAAINNKGFHIDECINRIDNLQKAIETNPEQANTIERFESYFIPETIGIIMTYIQYVRDNAPEDDKEVILQKAIESINALNEALDEKIDNIYQYSTMETVAKADALNKILAQNGYKKGE